MPLAPTPIVAVPSKPKIGFSIDSIVGGSNRTQSISPRSDGDVSNQSVLSESPLSSPRQEDAHHHRTTVHSPVIHRGTPSPSPSISPSATPPLDPGRTSPAPPTIIRPSALPPGALPPFSKSLYLPEHLVHPGHHHHQLALAAAAAQHFQGVAGLAAALGNGTFLPPSGGPGGGPNGAQPPTGGLLPPGHHPPPPPRDTYPLYPWLLSRHGRIFPHRFPGGKLFHVLSVLISSLIIKYK